MRLARPSGARAAALLVVLAALATYANSVTNGFALDDNFIIRTNTRVHNLGDLGGIWLTPYWPFYGQTLGLYRPLAIFAYALEWAAGGGAAWVFHAANILMHAGVSVLVWLLLRRLATPGGALVGGLLFAVHPVHTEVVANMVGQAELISAAAVLGACLLHVTRPADGLRPGRLALILLFLLCGVLAKEVAIIAPGLLVVLDAATGRLRPERATVRRYVTAMAIPLACMLVTLLAYLLLRYQVLGSIAGADAAPNLPFLRQENRFLSALRVWPEYFRLLFFPLDLSADYSPAVILPVTSQSPLVVLGGLLLFATVALAIATPWRSAVGLPAAWFFIAVFPVSNLVLPIGVLLAERILYLPSVAVAFVAASVWPHLVRATQSRPRLAPALVAGVVVLMGVRSAIRNPDWRSTLAVWDALIRDHPESYRAQWANGAILYGRGNLDLARQYWELALRIWPYDPELLGSLGLLYLRFDMADRAVPLLERARDMTPYVERTYTRLAVAYLATDRAAEALTAAQEAERHGVDPAVTLALTAQAYEGLGRFQEAADAWRAATARPQGRTWALFAMQARAHARTGMKAEALAAADTALILLPENVGPAARADLAQLRAAVEHGCYSDPSSHSDAPLPPRDSTCRDPLAGWATVLPAGAQEIASTLQNAMN